MMSLIQRPRRLRRSPALRRMVRETALGVDDLIAPLFIAEGRDIIKPIGSMPGHAQRSVDRVGGEIDELAELHIPAVLLFFVWRRRVPFRWMFVMFGAFIVSCGFTHFMEVVTMNTPLYRLSGLIKLATAAISWAGLR